jgi:hypothetical protein
MSLEERLARAVESKTAPLTVPVVDVEEVRRRGRRQRRRRTTLVLAAASALVAGTVVAVASQAGSGRSGEPVDKTPAPSPSSARPLTYAEGDTIRYGDQTIDTGLDLSSLTLTDDGVAFATGDGRIWFTDGSAPEQIGATDLDVLRAWGFSADSARGARAVVSDAAGSEAAWFEYPAPDRTEIVVYDTAEGEVVDRVAIDVPRGCEGDCAQILGVDADRLYWTEAPCALDPPDAFECMDKVPAPRVLDLGTGERSALSVERYAAELSTRTRIIGPRGQSRLDRSDGIGVASGHENLRFLALDGRLQAVGADGLGQQLYDVASGTRLRLDPPAGVKQDTSFRLFQWLDDDSFALVRADAYADRGDMIVVCRLTTRACDTAVPPSASADLVVPNR